MKRGILITLCSIAVLGGCQRTETTSVTDTSATMSESAGSTAAGTSASEMPATAAPYDLQFIDSLTKHHQMAVDMAKAGQPKFQRQELKNTAKKIVDDQSKEIAQLRAWRDQWYPNAPTAENMQMPGMSSTSMDMSHMQMMTGSALDLMFVDMMIPHHEGALAMAQDALAKAEHQELKDLSRKVIASQQKEIDQMQKWKKAWTK